MDNQLTFSDVTKRFANALALKNVSARFKEGSITGLVGENGAGKSTFIHIAAGVVRPDSGTVSVPPGRVGWCAQRQVIDWYVNTVTNVWLGARLAGMQGREAWSAAEQALEDVGLGAQAQAGPETLSGGQQQRLMVARALVAPAALLLLDEPTVGLDAESVSHLQTTLHAVAASGTIIILSSHEFETLEPVIDEVLFLDRGQVCFHGARDGFIATHAGEDTVHLRYTRPIDAPEGLGYPYELTNSNTEVVFQLPRQASLVPLVQRAASLGPLSEAHRSSHTLRSAIKRARHGA